MFLFYLSCSFYPNHVFQFQDISHVEADHNAYLRDDFIQAIEVGKIFINAECLKEGENLGSCEDN